MEAFSQLYKQERDRGSCLNQVKSLGVRFDEKDLPFDKTQPAKFTKLRRKTNKCRQTLKQSQFGHSTLSCRFFLSNFTSPTYFAFACSSILMQTNRPTDFVCLPAFWVCLRFARLSTSLSVTTTLKSKRIYSAVCLTGLPIFRSAATSNHCSR